MTRTRIKETCEILAIALIGSAILTTAHAAEQFGRATCYREKPGSECAAAWDFSSTPRTFYFIERLEFDVEKTSWQRVEGPVRDSKGISDRAVAGSYLYRVVGCNDEVGAVDCVSSTVFWAPARPANLDDIPDVVHSPTGYYLRDRNHSRELQILDYNIALMSRLVDTVDMSAMPPMTSLSFSDLRSLPPGTYLEEATLDYNVHAIYPLH